MYFITVTTRQRISIFSILLIYMGYNLFFPSIDVSHLSSPFQGRVGEGREICSFPDMLDAEKMAFDIPLDPAATKYAPTSLLGFRNVANRKIF